MSENQEGEEREEAKAAQSGAHDHVHGPGCDHDHSADEPFRRAGAKVGRNDPCSCGSGKKFKKCCGKAG